MDSARFDALSRTLSTAPSRRRLAQTLSVILLGLALPSRIAQSETAARNGGNRDKKRKPCPPCTMRKDGRCRANQPDGTACANDGRCQGGSCIPTPRGTVPIPLLVCPPVCPTCQVCNAVSGQCEVDLNGQPGINCVAPKVCCGGSCCDPIHECNSAGTCATCAEVCLGSCTVCYSLADRGTICGIGNSTFCATCSTSADCPPTEPHCVTSRTEVLSNFTDQDCGDSIGTGLCFFIHPC